MNRKILALAVAATLVAPMATYADVKFSGTIQGEAGGATLGQENGEEVDTLRISQDTVGNLFHDGPNHLKFDIDEKLGGDLTAWARYRATFNTANNQGLTRGQEAFLGLKNSDFWFRFGKIDGNYKSSHVLVDPFAGTAIQTRNVGAGMSAGKRLDIAATPDPNGKMLFTDAMGKVTRANLKTVIVDTNHRGLAHSGQVDNVFEIGGKYNGLSLSFQGVFDETADLDGAGLIELKYTAPNELFTVFAAASYLDFGDAGNTLSNNNNDDKGQNWKVGGQFKIGLPAEQQVILGLQYEDAELGAFDPNPDGGSYILGSLDYKIGNVLVGGWVAAYLSDIEDSRRWVINGEAINEDALNWAVGVKYLFSKRTLAYAGYYQTDSDNDYRDAQAYGVGLRHSF